MNIDNKQVVVYINKIKSGVERDFGSMNHDTIELIKKETIFFRHINREHNSGADDLAKQGGCRSCLVMGWC